MADSYIAMINNRPHRNSMIGYSAMKNVLNDNGRHFDPKILKVFLESMGIYPIGSIVQLNNSAIGRVVETHSEAPLRPTVELIIDEYGNKLGEREVVDLLTKKGTFIVKAVDPKALAPSRAAVSSAEYGAQIRRIRWRQIHRYGGAMTRQAGSTARRGAAGEERAASYLAEPGWTVLERNFRPARERSTSSRRRATRWRSSR